MQVTTSCSPDHNDFCTSLGATATINYHKHKFEDLVTDFDVVFDPFSFLYKKRTLKCKVLQPVKKNIIQYFIIKIFFAKGGLVYMSKIIASFAERFSEKSQSCFYPGNATNESFEIEMGRS